MKLNLLDYKELKSYPSGSGIEFYDDKIYLVGDDATGILITDTRWKNKEEIPLFDDKEKRIPKKTKADLEATAILHLDKMVYLIIMGSGSKEPRNKVILLNIETGDKTEIDCSFFYQRLGAAGIAEVSGVKSVLSTAFATTVALARHGTSVSAIWRREALTKIKRVLRVRTAAMISGVMNISLLMSFPRQLHTTGIPKTSPSTVAR